MKAISWQIIAWLVLCASSCLATDFYLVKAGQEYIDNWALTEAVAIQEGNLVTSLSKSERFLLSSQLVKGIQIADIDRGALSVKVLAEFGSIRPLAIEDIPKTSGKTTVVRNGIFTYRGYREVSANNSVVVVFEIKPEYAVFFSLIYCASLGIMLGIFYVLQRRLTYRELGKRVIFLKSALEELSTSGEPSHILAQECPGLLNVWDSMRTRLEQFRIRELELVADAQFSELATQVSHDIRSPVAALRVVIDQIENDEPDSASILKVVLEDIDEIAGLLLERRREAYNLTADSLPIDEVRQVSVSDLARGAVAQAKLRYANRKGVTIEFIGGEGSPAAYAQVNPSRLKRVIANLINNAVDACGVTGTVNLKVELDQGSVTISTLDTGCGIPEDILPYLGKKGKTFGKSSGNGLGLYDAKRTVESWRGTLDISSKVNAGTVVVIRIPSVGVPTSYA
jgi:signal transduction histidine kinase